MTHPDDNRDDGRSREDADAPYDEDALWRAIVENYGERPEMGPDPVDEAPAAGTTASTETVSPADLFDRTYLDSVEAARAAEARREWGDEGHFVPPEPPPLPRTTPARLLAWIGLFGAPLLMLLAVVFSWTFPVWVAMALVVGFVGGFVVLVATMSRENDDWPGDDGAVV